ncbi:hypothetical protein [Parasutterella sp.]|jgi:hypothetical protein|uniref:hypothetical protein n=1 Tax=Parasutterella sp. TaxID=2049037 RepID=UPI003AF00868
MANPTWFVAKDYLANKLAQLQATEPEGNWNVYSMAQAFANSGYEGEEGAYQHFLDFGMNEEVSPNALFDVDAYYANKLDALKSDPKTATEWADKTVADVKDAFAANGLSAWEHYQQFGTAEGINPSADFDTMKYLQAKTDAMNAVGGDKVWTVADIADAFAENGLSAIQHYELYGKSGAEGEVAEGYNPAPVVTLTFADALAAETLPAEYFLADGAASLEGVAVADLEAAQAKAQSIFDGALNKADLEYSVAYTLTDTLANIVAADAAVLEGHAYTLTDGVLSLEGVSVADAQAALETAQARIDGSANETKPVLEATYTLADSLANIMAAGDFVGEADYTLTEAVAKLGELAVADVKAAKEKVDAVVAGATNPEIETSYTFTLNDSVANIQAAGAELLKEAAGYILNDSVANIQAAGDLLTSAAGYILTDSVEEFLKLQATDADMFNAAEKVFAIDSVAAIDDADVAIIAFLNSLDGIIYKDSFNNLQNADRIGDANVTYTLTDAVTNKFVVTDVAVANVTAELAAAAEFVAGATNGATFEAATYGYKILDNIANIKAASNEVLLHAETDGVTVSDTLTAFNTGYDILTGNHGVDNAIATVAGDTTISSATMNAITTFNGIDITATVASAVTVDASKDASGATIDLTKFDVATGSKGLTFNATGSAQVDTITAHAKGGVLIGGAGVDALRGGAGVDVFAYTATTFDALKLEAGATGDTISAFTTGTDSIQLTKAIEALLTTTGDKINLVAASIGTLTTGDGARLIINDGKLILDQSGDTTATGGSLTDAANDDIVILTGINDLAVADIHFA